MPKHTSHAHIYPRHRKLPLRQQMQFLGLSILSLVTVFVIAMLSRAELRLSGQIFASDGDDLAVMEQLAPFETVELIRETKVLRLYILKRGKFQYLVYVVRENEEEKWEMTKMERLH